MKTIEDFKKELAALLTEAQETESVDTAKALKITRDLGDEYYDKLIMGTDLETLEYGIEGIDAESVAADTREGEGRE